MVVYIGDVDVRSALHHRGVVVCCRHGGATILAFRFTVLSNSFLLLLGLRRLLFFLALSIGFFFSIWGIRSLFRYQLLTLRMREQQSVFLRIVVGFIGL